MNWDAIGAIAEVGAAVTVIVTLIYLSQQIRHANIESRLSAVHDISSSYINWMQSIAASQKLSRIWDKGLVEYQALEQQERVRFILMMGSVLRIMDDAYRQYTSGRMNKEDWIVYENALYQTAGTSGAQAYFSQRESWHSEAFSKLLAGKISKTETRRETFYK